MSSEIRSDRINRVQQVWAKAAAAEEMTNEEVINCAGHFLANCVASSSRTEAAAHDLMNRLIEANHIYINAAWPEIERAMSEGRMKR